MTERERIVDGWLRRERMERLLASQKQRAAARQVERTERMLATYRREWETLACNPTWQPCSAVAWRRQTWHRLRCAASRLAVQRQTLAREESALRDAIHQHDAALAACASLLLGVPSVRFEGKNTADA